MTPTLDFLVIGAQKCATSWLYYCLGEHPRLHLPAAKREVHYLGGDLAAERGSEWYFSTLAGAAPGQLTGDVSVEYLFDPRSAAAVERHAASARLVAVLREPVERAVSAYHWYRRKGLLGDSGLGLVETLEHALEPAAATAGDATSDLLTRGLYGEQLGRYLDHIAADRFLVLAFDEVQSDPAGCLARCFAFLGVDPDFVPPSLGRRPKRNSYSPWLARAEARWPGSRWVAKAADLAHRSLARLRRGAAAPELSADLHRRLAAGYGPDRERLAEILDGLPPPNRPPRAILESWGAP